MPKRNRSLMDQAYLAIKDRIMTLQMRPGQRLDDIELGKQLDLSRTPVREALYRLSSEGLVTVSGSGFVVRSLDLLDVSQLFEAHLVVARTVGRLLAARATDEDLHHLRRAAGEVEQSIIRHAPAEVAVANAALHRLEASAAGNEHIKALAWSIHDQGQRLSYLCFGGGQGDQSGHVAWGEDLSNHFVKVCRDHDEFLTAVGDRDPDAAEHIASRHVHLFRDRVQQFMASELTETVSVDSGFPAVLIPGSSTSGGD